MAMTTGTYKQVLAMWDAVGISSVPAEAERIINICLDNSK